MSWRKWLTRGSIFLFTLPWLERFSVLPWKIGWLGYLCIGIFGLAIVLFIHGVEQYEKLASELQITKIIPREWTDEATKLRGREFFIEILNRSYGVSIHKIHVELIRIDPPIVNWLPAPLHLKHDNVNPFSTEFSLNPRCTKQVDLVMKIRGSKTLQIAHAVTGLSRDIPLNTYTLTVRISGEGQPSSENTFKAWLSPNGELHCVMTRSS